MAMRHPKATVLSGALSALFVMTVSAKDYLDFHFSVKGMCIRYDFSFILYRYSLLDLVG